MKNLKNILKLNFLNFNIFLLLLIFYSYKVLSNEISIEVIGNQYSDNEAIFSIIEKKPDVISEEYSNYLLKELNDSKLFQNVKVEIKNNKYLVFIEEYPSITKVSYQKNKRLKDEQLGIITNELNITNLNPLKINKLNDEFKKAYQSLGYNNIKIESKTKFNEINNTAELTFIFEEGEITKIKKVYFVGNENFSNDELFSKIKSKNKSLLNIFVNNNFKLFQIQNDILKLKKFYKNNGFKKININYEIEYLDTNKVFLYFKIAEGNKYIFSSIKYENQIKQSNEKLNDEFDLLLKNKKLESESFSQVKIESIEKDLSNILEDNGIVFFELQTLEKVTNNNVDVLYRILPTKPKYVNQININGNSRTYDYVIRRELQISEGDSLNKFQIKELSRQIKMLNLFETVEINEQYINDELVDIEIEVKEKQTGSFNAGLSFGTIDGFTFVTGLNEKNFGGTGRSIEFLINTSQNNSTYTFKSKDKYFYNYDLDFEYGINYSEKDFTNSSSYKLNTFTLGTGLGYRITNNLTHKINLDYYLKDYTVTNESSVSDSIKNVEGNNVSFILKNEFSYNTLNSFILPVRGNYFEYSNLIETPTSSTNGFLKNSITYKKYQKINENIFSFQTRLGNIISLNNNELIANDKFSLGGRWLRGYDVYGVGPRESRNSYVGGRNLAVTKFDFSKKLIDNSDNPIYFHLFNDYGLVWGNKTAPKHSDQSIRASYGLGLKFYSPIGPIGFTWGFPINDQDYDIKRMFLFSVGNLN
ncbi:MAG: outer membrane protein assembly factor BamA [Pelagibacteraceae bacterium]|nr:outer membrane protein assembly factor BamA [Pelagibacteraceae bacterium]|tara:strand:+ start:5431 stop:7704 length:2274 start_codon:yes stop_codon:yes gene_type:complete